MRKSKLVFQVFLLAGYAYAAFCSTWLASRQQAIIRICLLAVSGITMAVLAFSGHASIFYGRPYTPTRVNLASLHSVRLTFAILE